MSVSSNWGSKFVGVLVTRALLSTIWGLRSSPCVLETPPYISELYSVHTPTKVVSARAPVQPAFCKYIGKITGLFSEPLLKVKLLAPTFCTQSLLNLLNEGPGIRSQEETQEEEGAEHDEGSRKFKSQQPTGRKPTSPRLGVVGRWVDGTPSTHMRVCSLRK